MEDNNQEKQQVLTNSQDIFNAFKEEFATTVHRVKINSLKREIGFRDITVNEQKTLSKVSLENNNRKDVIYDTQCQLINTLCLEDGFSIYRLTEFDRIRILMEIYQSNFIKNDITYTCSECNTVNKYKLDFQKIINKFDAFTLEDEIYSTEDDQRVYKFTINYPLVRSVSNFYKDYSKKYRGITAVQEKILDNMGIVEYVNLFIKQIEVIPKNNPEKRIVADLTLMSYGEIEKLLGSFPQSVIYSDSNGVSSFIMTQFIDKLDGIFQYEKCAHCGA